MIELPATIVVYPHKKDDPARLLCWIPSESYAVVAADFAARESLEKHNPNGIELVCSEEGLQEAGIELNLRPALIRQAYEELLELDELPEDGVVELAAIREYLAARERLHLDDPQVRAAATEERLPLPDRLVDNLRRALPMKGTEKPQTVYRRFTAEPASPGEEE